jgi:hypothetical protein
MSFYDDASLMMIPSGAKDDKLYSIKPTDGNGDFTFSRDGSGASKATRINSSGLIEKGHTNEILKSNNFGDDATWDQSATTRTSGQTGYDGTTDAWEIVRSSSGAMALQQTISVTGVLTFSIYVKINASNGIGLNFGSLGAGEYARFNISDDQQTSAATETGLIASTQEYVGNDFYRLSITANTTQTSVRLYTTSADGTSGVSTGATYIIQDAQLQKGLVATLYHETDSTPVGFGLLGDMPRLDYSDGASCPCVLMEPARENKFTHSEYFGAWTAETGITITSNTSETTSPEGVYNAAKITSTDSTKGFYLDGLSVTKPASRTIYLKGASGGETLELKDASENGGSTSVTLTTSWERYEHKTTNTGDTFTGLFVDTIADGSTIYAYGAQFEEHPNANAQEANATSYIPTYGTAVSRAYDVTSELTYDDDFTSVVLFGEITMAEVVRDTTASAITMRKASGSGSRFFVYRNNSTIKRRAAIYRQNNTDSAALITLSTADRIKFAIQYNASNGSLKAFVNGTNALASPVTDPDFDEFVNFQLSGEGGMIKVHQFAALKATYTNDELATLTTI